MSLSLSLSLSFSLCIPPRVCTYKGSNIDDRLSSINNSDPTIPCIRDEMCSQIWKETIRRCYLSVNSREYETINWIFISSWKYLSNVSSFIFFFHRSSGFRIHFLIIIVLFLLLLPTNNRHLFILRMILTNAFPIPNSKYKKSSKIENQFQFANTFFPSLLNISKIQHFSPIFLPI